MAGKIELELNWLNESKFEMIATIGTEGPIVIVKIYENSDMASVWPHASALCLAYIKSRLDAIGTEMML